MLALQPCLLSLVNLIVPCCDIEYGLIIPAASTTSQPSAIPSFQSDPRIKQFLECRKIDIRAGAKEPHRSLLNEIIKNGSTPESVWAMTRITEAGDYQYFESLLNKMVAHVRGISQPKSGQEVDIIPGEIPGLGNTFRIHQSSPWWDALETLIRNDPEKSVSGGLYALWCYNTRPGQRELIINIASHITPRVRSASSGLDPWADPRFWIVLDWVIAWGNLADFDNIEACIPDGPARRAFRRHTKPLRDLPDYFSCTLPPPDSEGRIKITSIPSSKIDDKAPINFTQMMPRYKPNAPPYPAEARARRLTNKLVICTIVDPEGNTCGYRPLPGPWLAFFAPTGVNQIQNWKFNPAKANNIPIKSLFNLTMNFKLE